MCAFQVASWQRVWREFECIMLELEVQRLLLHFLREEVEVGGPASQLVKGNLY